MNAKQAEAATGISRRNLRFYEQQGLITPQRNPQNDYREYSQADIEALKAIRTLRMLDVPLEDIGAYLSGKMTLAQISEVQEKRLLEKQQEVQNALHFCRELGKKEISLDHLLEKMEQPEVRDSLFTGWRKDYLLVENAEALKFFSFVPDGAVTNAREFTDALCQYGTDHNLDLIITKEGMNPEFTIDGIEYTAERIYRAMGYSPLPLAMIYCTAKDPDLLTADMPKGKRAVFSIFRNWWPMLIILIPEIMVGIHYQTPLWEMALIILSTIALLWSISWNYRSNRTK